MNISIFSDDVMDNIANPTTSILNTKKGSHIKAVNVSVPHSVTSNNDLTIPTKKIQPYESKSLLFFSPDVHDGTMTDLAISLNSQGHSIYFYNNKGALPIYTGLREVTLSEEEYLQLSGTNNKSRIIFASRQLCKTSKLFAYNMKSVQRLWWTFHNDILF